MSILDEIIIDTKNILARQGKKRQRLLEEAVAEANAAYAVSTLLSCKQHMSNKGVICNC